MGKATHTWSIREPRGASLDSLSAAASHLFIKTIDLRLLALELARRCSRSGELPRGHGIGFRRNLGRAAWDDREGHDAMGDLRGIVREQRDQEIQGLSSDLLRVQAQR